MRIFLIQPPVAGEERYGEYSDVGSYLPSLGICYIASLLEKHGHEVRIIDGIIETLSINEITQKIKEFNADIVGLTATSLCFDAAKVLAIHIRKKKIETKIVLGGVHLSVFLDKALEKCFDFGVYGEGEITFLELVNELESGKNNFSHINGLIYQQDGNTIMNKPRSFIENLDELPPPSIQLLNRLYEYKIRALMYKQLPMMTMISSRGCPYDCLFCSNSLFGKRYRFHSSNYVLNELDRYLNEYGFREIMFYEDNFPVNKERVFDICEGILKNNWKFTWGCSSHISCLSEEVLNILKKAGCWIISVGIESGDKHVLKILRKNYNHEHLVKMVKYAAKIGIAVRGFFIIGNPCDTEDSIRKTIDLAKQLPLYTVNFCLMSLFPGSKFYNTAEHYGQVDYDLSLVTGHPNGDRLSFVPKGFTPERMIHLQKKAYKEFYLRPSQIWRTIRAACSPHDFIKYYRLFKTFMKVTS